MIIIIKKQTPQWPKEKAQTLTNKTLYKKIKIEQHEPHNNRG
jgi:hypothetical protein